MAKAAKGWIYTTHGERLRDFMNHNTLLKDGSYDKKNKHLPPIQLHYETPRLPSDKHWTDNSLLSARNVDDYLSESDAYQRASFANIMARWKQYEENETMRQLSSIDSRYNMKLRFRSDTRLNRPTEMDHGPSAKYHRHVGHENNPKNTKPCGRHKRLVEDYQQRHVTESLKLPSKTKTRRQAYFFPKFTRLPPIDTSFETSSVITSSVSAVEDT